MGIIGTSLMNYLLNEFQFGMIWCRVRNNLIPFYQKLGFEKGEKFSENDTIMIYLKKI